MRSSIISFTTLNQIITKVTTTTYGDITQIYSYTTRTITTRYISTTAPSVPTYTNVSTKFTPTIYKREYRTAAGDIFSPGVFEMIVLRTLVFKDPIKTEINPSIGVNTTAAMETPNKYLTQERPTTANIFKMNSIKTTIYAMLVIF